MVLFSFKLSLESPKEEDSTKDQSTASIIAAVIAGLVGILVGLIAAGAQYRMNSDELFYKALDFLGGGTQHRNLGIAAIELSWNKQRYRPVSTALLIGSVLYLLLESKQEQAAHEVYNLRRIMKRLLHPNAYKVSTQAGYEQLQAALQKARQAAEVRESGTTLGVSRGLSLSPACFKYSTTGPADGPLGVKVTAPGLSTETGASASISRLVTLNHSIV